MAEPVLDVGRPWFEGERIRVSLSLGGAFDPEIRTALESGLPATLTFRWDLMRERQAWWDARLASGEVHLRIFYDLLGDTYAVFDHAGRRVAACETLGEVEAVACKRDSVPLFGAPPLEPDRRYYLACAASLEPLDVSDVRDLEEWLEGYEEDAAAELSRRALELFRGLVGLDRREAEARSPTFTLP